MVIQSTMVFPGHYDADIVTRLTALTARDADAAAALCRHAVKEGMPVVAAAAVCRALAVRLSAGSVGNNNNTGSKAGKQLLWTQ